MSEPVLKALIKLFALVAREDEVTHQERQQILAFLNDHLSTKQVESYIQLFDKLSNEPRQKTELADEKSLITKIANEINQELTQKQKSVIMMELVVLVFADDTVSNREEELIQTIAKAFNINKEEADTIKKFVFGQDAQTLDNPAILVATNQTQNSAALSQHKEVAGLNGLLVFLYLENAEMFFFKYLGNGDILLNGVPQKPGKISVFATGSTLRSDHTETIYFGDIQKRFKRTNESTPITFEANNISYRFKKGNLGLRNVTIKEESGKLIALMGASGAGKSTLLHVLNGSESPSEGEVLINGIDLHKEQDKLEGVIGFVPQDDLLIEDLTVYQNLYYAAKLCFSNYTEEQIEELVSKTLEDLGLQETKNLKVGSPLQKTISGGQRKRLNIGLELLREPGILFLDEPTSGLSSRDSENIIDLLKELSFKGKLLFVVIHQPSSDIFKMFDKLVVLDTGGYQIFYGNPVDAVIYFKKCINMINSDMGECHECGNVNPEQIFNIIETKVINEYGNFTNERKVSPEQWNQLYTEKIRIADIRKENTKPVSNLNIPGRLKQAVLFGMRDLKSKISNSQYLSITLLEAPLLAFILAFIVRYYNVDDKVFEGYVFSKNLNMPAYLFMSVIVALFMGLTVSAEEIIRDRKILKREAFLHLSRSSYLLSKISILFLISAIQTISFVLVGNYILEIKDMVFNHWVILFSAACMANLLGLNISSAFNSAVTIYILIPILLIPQLILSGVVVKFDKLNPVMGNSATVPLVGDLMTSRWAFEAAMVSQFKDNPFEKEFYLYDKAMADSDYKKLYYIPELETRMQYCLNNFRNNSAEVKAQVDFNLALIQREISRELDFVGKDKFTRINDLVPAKFDSTLYNQSMTFLNNLRRFYSNRFNQADQEREKKIMKMTDTPENEKAFEIYKNNYHNESITELVKNLNEQQRIIEADGKLVQKIYPIYKDPDPDHLIDFDAQFYMPAKHFLNRDIDTLWFNLGVIWMMTLILAITLYFEILRKIVDGLGKLANPIGT
jgi:ABC transport system ATP-binding/permease protein